VYIIFTCLTLATVPAVATVHVVNVVWLQTVCIALAQNL